MSTQITDGTVKWETKDIRIKAIVDLLYPVGTVIAVANNNTPAFTKYGTWSKIGSGRVLWGADASHKAGTTIEPGLPNITGNTLFGGRNVYDNNSPSGAFYKKSVNGFTGYPGGTENSNSPKLYFDASKSNDIYGNSETVQPPAYVVTFWKRTA